MDKIKKFIDCYIPTETCNLRCHYCYIAQQNKFNKKLARFTHSPEMIRAALSKSRLGGICMFNLCAGGETLLSEDVLSIVKELLNEGHYVMIVTNGTATARFQEISNWSKDALSRLFFKFSLHYLELKRMNLLEQFVKNVNLARIAGASFTIEITPSDELIPYIPELKKFCLEKFDAYCHSTIARDDRTNGIDILSKYDLEEYKKIWGTLDSELFRFKSEIFYHHRTEFCYAGEWSVYLNLETGDMKQCYCGVVLDNIYDDISKPLKFRPIGKRCTLPHCYNGHAFLTFGCIPELKTPSYADLRNRICTDGSEWLQPAMKEVMTSKLVESNQTYSWVRRIHTEIKNANGLKQYLSKYPLYQKLKQIRDTMRKEYPEELE